MWALEFRHGAGGCSGWVRCRVVIVRVVNSLGTGPPGAGEGDGLVEFDLREETGVVRYHERKTAFLLY